MKNYTETELDEVVLAYVATDKYRILQGKMLLDGR
jgi:hypothetical protein